ncbi:MAG: 3-hydroxyacyl-CoA dehydrogenase [Actinomycetota bacterium]|nr:3-hydroxyacyl-CoA dehydrogenase [Actinomycetota bacterium]
MGPVAVVGGGTIGVAWSIVFARAGRVVALYEPDDARRALARDDVIRRLRALAVCGLLDEDPGDVAGRVRPGGDLPSAVRGATYVQECAPEDADLKRALFEELEGLAAPDAVLASSSSAIPPSSLAPAVRDPSRVLVAHPGNPPYLLPVVEVVPSPLTSAATVERARGLLSSVGMSPIVLRREVEGFVFNRLQGAVLREAYCLVRDGVVDPQDVDTVMREGLGRRWAFLGPFETVELNTEGGIDEHAARMGPAYARMGAERGQHDPWTDEMVAQVSAAVQARLPRERWRDHVLWRDSALMALEAFRRRTPLLAGPSPAEPAGAGGAAAHAAGVEPARAGDPDGGAAR